MSTYVIGDVHGCYNKFLNILDLINYQDDDEIICVGDYIDRGEQNYEMLRWIENYPDNFLLIRGNHEAEFSANIDIMIVFANHLGIDENSNQDAQILYQTLCQTSKVKEAYFDYYTTIQDLIFNHYVTLSQLIYWKKIIEQMPYIYKKTINGIKHVIVHAGYKQNDVNFYIYARKETYFKNGIVIAGHTPTNLQNEFSFNSGQIYKNINFQLNSTYINIDCGCVYPNGKLACLRLEDMKEYYI